MMIFKFAGVWSAGELPYPFALGLAGMDVLKPAGLRAFVSSDLQFQANPNPYDPVARIMEAAKINKSNKPKVFCKFDSEIDSIVESILKNKTVNIITSKLSSATNSIVCR